MKESKFGSRHTYKKIIIACIPKKLGNPHDYYIPKSKIFSAGEAMYTGYVMCFCGIKVIYYSIDTRTMKPLSDLDLQSRTCFW